MTKWTKLQCPRSHHKPDLFIYLLHFVYICCSGMILCDLATCVWQQICDKASPCQNLSNVFSVLVVCCVTLTMVNMSNYSTKEHLGTWHKAHRSDNESVMKVWVSSNLGHLHAKKLLIMGKTYIFIWECKTLLEIADQYLTVMHAAFIEQSLHTSVHNQQSFWVLHLNMSDHMKKDLKMKSIQSRQSM
jgi:hypothetical protein